MPNILSDLMGTNTGKGAALGALMSKLLTSIDEPGGVNKGVDMSKVGNIAPRTTQIPTGRYVPYSEYGARDAQPNITPELARALGLPSGLQAQGPLSQYNARPKMDVEAQPQTMTSAGTGSNVLLNPTITPRGTNTIDPLTGVLLGGALGYLMPETKAYSSSGATQSGQNAVSDIGNILKKIPGYETVSDWFGFADGGLATPLMADGGQVPSYYTYGQIVNPADILNQMAQGGQPKQGGLHVPTVEGRHDYRAGARVTGEGDGQSDDIPAMLADGEYVIDAETVAQLGNGSTKAGSDLLDKFREEIRGHKRSAPLNKIPPQSKSPLAYLATAQKKLGAKNA